MKKIWSVISIILGGLILIAGCSADHQKPNNKTEAEVFYFSSGGAYHFEGYGEWIVTCTKEGDFTIKHNVKGKVTDYKSHKLKKDERERLWELITNANVNEVVESPRAGLPDEVAYTFKFLDPDQKTSPELTPGVVIWVNDAHENKNIMNLINYIGTLIKTYTGKIPVLN